MVIFRYRSLVPLMYLLLPFEALLRQFVGHSKPVTFAHKPPGAIADYISLPLAAPMQLSLWRASRPPRAVETPQSVFGEG